MSKLLERMDKITGPLSEAEHKLFLDSRFPYILTKADLYLRIGPEKYRRQDFFHMPDIEWYDYELEVIANGCRQILEGNGFTPDKPFTGMGVTGFRQLFSLFHFENSGRETSNIGIGKFLDKMEMSHAVDGGKVTYYNLVEYETGKSDDSL